MAMEEKKLPCCLKRNAALSAGYQTGRVKGELIRLRAPIAATEDTAEGSHDVSLYF